jgi:putative addiction module CopG family antidote
MYFEDMSVTVPAEYEAFIAEQIRSGRFRDASQVVAAALQVLEADPLKGAPVFPPGSLSHLYTAEANAEEARTAADSSLKVEAW